MYIIDIAPLVNLPKNQINVLSYFYKEPIQFGSLVLINLKNRKVKGVVLDCEPIEKRKMFIKRSDFEFKKILKVILKEAVSKTQFEISQWISDYYYVPLGTALRVVLLNIPLIYKNYSNNYQNETNKFKIDGSKQILILVPQNSLTEYYKSLLLDAGYSQSEISLINSDLPKKELIKEIKKITTGQSKAIIGSRYALFVPFKNLKKIIIVDEIDPSHWSEMTPKIFNPTVAKFIARLYKAEISYDGLFSVNTYGKEKLEIKNEKKYKESNVEIINMRVEFRKGNFSIFSEKLKKKLDDIISKNGKVLLYVPRKGYANYILCRNCQTILKCENCEVPLVHHKFLINRKLTDELVCHHCYLKKELLKFCPKCGYYNLKSYGFGTQKVEEELRINWPDLNILRIDRDVFKKLKFALPLIKKFNQENKTILISTSMILGYRYFIKPNFIGVLSIDNLIKIPDFQSEERLFREIIILKSIVNKNGGEMMIQTIYPDNKIVQFVSKNDQKSFFEYELENRKLFKYPPFYELVKLTYRRKNYKIAENEAEILAKNLKNYVEKNFRKEDFIIIGPSLSWVAKEKGEWIFNIAIKIKIDSLKSEINQEWLGNRNRLLSLIPPSWEIEVEPKEMI